MTLPVHAPTAGRAASLVNCVADVQRVIDAVDECYPSIGPLGCSAPSSTSAIADLAAEVVPQATPELTKRLAEWRKDVAAFDQAVAALADYTDGRSVAARKEAMSTEDFEARLDAIRDSRAAIHSRAEAIREEITRELSGQPTLVGDALLLGRRHDHATR